MAGIGFTLKRLASQDNLIGIVRAHTHATVASAGPWLFAVMALGGVWPIFQDYVAVPRLINFRIIVVYNFGFSLILASPFYMVVTRYLADCIHRRDVTHTPTVMLQSLTLMHIFSLPVAILYYGMYVELSLGLRLSAIADLFLCTSVWVLGIYLTALKNYKAVTMSFGMGMVIAVIAAQLLTINDIFGDASTLTGFNIGLMYIVFSLAGHIFGEYPYRIAERTYLKRYYKRYWELAVSGVCYNGAIWIDKCVMWAFAPESITLPSKMVYYPDYDVAMFFAYITIIPSMAIFIYSVETNFFQRYQRFYYDILEHKPLSTIKANHQAIIKILINSARNFFVVQGAICIVTILLAAEIFKHIPINYISIGIFRLGVLGSIFHVLMIFECVVLSYFDCRKQVMWIHGVFLVSCGIFTYISILMGFPYYGYGYFASSLLVFVLASIALFDHIQKLPYHAFITNNNSLRQRFQEEDNMPLPETRN